MINERGNSIQQHYFLFFRHSIMPKPWGPSPMTFHSYSPWFGWYALPMQYESFYPRSAEHESNAFDRLAQRRKDNFYQKFWFSQEQPNQKSCSENQKFRFGNPEVLVFPTWVSHIELKRVYHVKQKPNSNEGLNQNTQDGKMICENDNKQQQSTDINLGPRTRDMS
jgi:hypothetical protein